MLYSRRQEPGVFTFAEVIIRRAEVSLSFMQMKVLSNENTASRRRHFP